MSHENFKVFRLTNSQILNGQIDEFIKGKLTLKSLSLTEIPRSNQILVSIGYTEDETEHEYHVITSKLGTVNAMTDDQISEALNLAAHELEGIICQDIAIIDNVAVATFLTIKK